MLAWAIALTLVVSRLEVQAQSSKVFTNVATNSAAPAGPGPVHGIAAPLSGMLYFGFDAGVAFQHDIKLSDTAGDSETVAFDPGFRMDCAVGYNFTTNWAAEFAFGFIANQVQYSYALGTDYSVVDLFQFPLMVNVIYARPLGKRCSVYAGGGIGVVFAFYENQYCYTTPTASTFGYQGMAGIKFALNTQWDIGVGYKFLGTTGYDVGSGVSYDGSTRTEYKSDGNMTQSIQLTITCRF